MLFQRRGLLWLGSAVRYIYQSIGAVISQKIDGEEHAHPPRVVYCAIYPTLTRFTVSSLKFAYFQGRLSRHNTEKAKHINGNFMLKS